MIGWVSSGLSDPLSPTVGASPRRIGTARIVSHTAKPKVLGIPEGMPSSSIVALPANAYHSSDPVGALGAPRHAETSAKPTFSSTARALNETTRTIMIPFPSWRTNGREPQPCFRNSPKKQARLSHAAMQLVTFGSPAFVGSGTVTFCPDVTVGLALSCNVKSVSTLFQENFQPSISVGKADRCRLGGRCARPLIRSDARRVVASALAARHTARQVNRRQPESAQRTLAAAHFPG